MTGTVKFTCHDCAKDVTVTADQIRLDFAAGDPGAVTVTETCHLGHTSEQRLTFNDDAHRIDALIHLGVQTPSADDVETHLAAITAAAAWLDSPTFDAERASLRVA
jgi:hypothetical protein